MAVLLCMKKDAPNARMAISATPILTERMMKAVLFCFLGGDGVNTGGIPLPCPFGDGSVVGYIVAV